MIERLLIAAGTAAAGACVGSFAATSAVRATRGEQALAGRSRCDGCGAALGFAETVPVLSYVARRGACRVCGAGIDPTHLAGELTGGLVAASAILLADWPRSAALACLGLALVAASLIDARTRRLPDGLTLVVALIGAGLAFASGPAAIQEGVLASAVTFVMLELVRRGFLWLKRAPGLGFGDVKLVAALALWLGMATPWMVVVAAILGLAAFVLVRPADGRLPFGPSLAAAAWLIGLTREAHLWLL